ncbi:MAG TPA: Omp28-related outer membrane protein [Ignavibacteriaceae bacterium]
MKIFLLLIIPLMFLGCETNPPTQPISLKDGEVKINITISEDNSISSDRTVLLEDFANVSCTPCVTSNKIIQSVINSYGSSKIVSVKFPTNFPSPVDPFYLAAKEFCDFRMTYYNILFAPTIILDGITLPTPTDSNAIKQSINNRLTIPSNFNVTVAKTVVNGGLLLNVDIKLKNKNSLDLDDLFLRCAIVESEVEYEQPPGSNGETKFYDVLRVLLPSNEGISLSSVGSALTYQFENTIDTVWNIDKLEAVMFIQSSANKEIQQTGSSF